MRNILPIIIACILLIGFLLPRHNTSPVSAVTADHVVISEVQIAGGTSSDEFVELYNPTNSSIDMTGWTLYRKTTSAASAEIAIATPSGSIAAHGFHLIAHQDFDGGVTANTSYTGQNIASNNSVILRDAGSQLMDLVGMGTSETSETTPVLNPIDNRSIERKALSTSTEPDMAPGGAHATFGNGEDTDNNVNDFVRHVSPNVSDPQNASSPTETPAEVTPSVTPTPTEGPTSTPTPTGEPTNTPTPTEELTQTPTPTEEVTSTPTPTPSEEPTGTPTQIPTETPTSTPTPTEEPTETPTPTHTVTPTQSPTSTPTITPTPTITLTLTPTSSPTSTPKPTPTGKVLGVFPTGKGVIVCSLNYRLISVGWWKIYLPKVTCERVENHENNTDHDNHIKDYKEKNKEE